MPAISFHLISAMQCIPIPIPIKFCFFSEYPTLPNPPRRDSRLPPSPRNTFSHIDQKPLLVHLISSTNTIQQLPSFLPCLPRFISKIHSGRVPISIPSINPQVPTSFHVHTYFRSALPFSPFLPRHIQSKQHDYLSILHLASCILQKPINNPSANTTYSSNQSPPDCSSPERSRDPSGYLPTHPPSAHSELSSRYKHTLGRSTCMHACIQYMLILRTEFSVQSK